MEYKKMTTSNETNQKKYINNALCAFQAEANSASKSSDNPFFKSKYASLESVIETANKGSRFGLSFTQVVDYKMTHHEGTKIIDMWVETVLMHNDTQQQIISKYPIIPKNNDFDDSQKIGSAITYAKRYALQAIYGIPSEDDDGNSNTSISNTSIKYDYDFAPYRYFKPNGELKNNEQTSDIAVWSQRIEWLIRKDMKSSLHGYKKEMQRILKSLEKKEAIEIKDEVKKRTIETILKAEEILNA